MNNRPSDDHGKKAASSEMLNLGSTFPDELEHLSAINITLKKALREADERIN